MDTSPENQQTLIRFAERMAAAVESGRDLPSPLIRLIDAWLAHPDNPELEEVLRSAAAEIETMMENLS